MITILLYLLTVCIWGTTWLAIKLQIGHIPLEVSIFYRFVLAAFFLLLFCKIRRVRLQFSSKDHALLALLGLCMFSVHFIFIYSANAYLISGVVSVLFSLVSVFNIINAYLFYKKRPEKHVVIGACVGLLGISLFFWKEFIHFTFESKALIGVGYALIGAMLFSSGNMISRKIQDQKMALIPSTCMAMIYGATFMFIYCLIRNVSFGFPADFVYWGSLFYLAIPGSIVAFLSYLYLISRIGPEKAGYATVFFPAIALFVSILFEEYRLVATDVFGFVCIMIGNYLVMSKRNLLTFIRKSTVKNYI